MENKAVSADEKKAEKIMQMNKSVNWLVIPSWSGLHIKKLFGVAMEKSGQCPGFTYLGLRSILMICEQALRKRDAGRIFTILSNITFLQTRRQIKSEHVQFSLNIRQYTV